MSNYKPLVNKFGYNELVKACKKNGWELLNKEEIKEAYKEFGHLYEDKSYFRIKDNELYYPYPTKYIKEFSTTHNNFLYNAIVKKISKPKRIMNHILFLFD